MFFYQFTINHFAAFLICSNWIRYYVGTLEQTPTAFCTSSTCFRYCCAPVYFKAACRRWPVGVRTFSTLSHEFFFELVFPKSGTVWSLLVPAGTGQAIAFAIS